MAKNKRKPQIIDRFEYLTLEQLKDECRRLEYIEDTLSCYEATNGEVGETYVRVYVWAQSYDEALLMAKRAFQENGCKQWDFGFIELRRLFRRCDDPFVTKPSDIGFSQKYPLEHI